MTIPTTQECVDAAVAAIESRLGQTVPLYDRSFLNVLSVVLGMNNAQLYRFGVQRKKQVLALTARGDDLTDLGREYGIIRKPAQKAVLSFTPSYTGSVNAYIYRSDSLTLASNDMFYLPTQDYVFLAGTGGDINARAEFAGADGNLEVGVTGEFASLPVGLSSKTVTVSGIVSLGADEETDDELRLRILTEIQTVGGGSNDADYRRWGQETPNVLRVDPYTGRPPWVPSSFVPGERTVYVESTPSYDPDGNADAALLNLVRQYIEYDQESGLRQVCLGSTSDSLAIYSITRRTAYFQINNLSVESSRISNCTADIETTLNDMVRAMHPFILGLDSEAFSNSVLSSAMAARQVQRIVQSYGGSCGTVFASMSYGDWDNPPYTLDPGERLKADAWNSVEINVAS